MTEVEDLPERYRRVLIDNDVDVSDPEIRRAVLLVLTERRTSLRTALQGYKRRFLRGLAKEMERTAEKSGRLAGRMTAVLILAGLFSAAAKLVSGFEPFKDSLNSLLKNLVGWLHGIVTLGMPAYAQSITPTPFPPASQLIGPVFVYLVYVLFSLGYVACLFGLFFGRRPKDQANAMEILRNLTAFFIGAISGKFV